MTRETIDEFLARGGHIQQIPTGLSKETAETWKWSEHSLPVLSNRSRKKLEAYIAPPKKPVAKKKYEIYLEHIKKYPDHKPRHVAKVLGWTPAQVSDARKTGIKKGHKNP